MGNVSMEARDINYRGGETKMSVEDALKSTSGEAAAIEQLQATKANKTDIATEFSDLTNYNAGDLVYYDGALYEFQADHTAGAWETSEVIQKDLSDIVTTLKSGLTNMITRVNTDNTVAVGATDTIALPSGMDSTKVAILSCFLVVGSALYYDSAEVTTVHNGAITVKNTGGAAGYICIDYSVIN